MASSEIKTNQLFPIGDIVVDQMQPQANWYGSLCLLNLNTLEDI